MRILKHLVQAVLLVITLLIGLTAGFLIVSQTGWFRGWLRGVVERGGNRFLNGHLSIGSLRGNILAGISLHDVRVEMNGQPAIAIGSIGAEYDLLQLLGGHLVVDSVRLDAPVITVERQPNGRLNLSSLVRPQQQPSGGKGTTRFQVANIRIIDGEVSLPARPVGTSGESDGPRAPQRIENLNAHLSFTYAPSSYTVGIDRLSLVGLSPDIELKNLSGSLAVRDGELAVQHLALETGNSSLRVDGTVARPGRNASFDLKIDSGGIDFAELGRLIPTLSRFALHPALHADLAGPLNAMRIAFRVSGGASGVDSGNLVLNATAPDHRLAGTVRLRRFDLHPLLPPPSSQHSDVTGTARFDIGFVKTRFGTDIVGSYRVQAERASAFGYGGRDVTAIGRIAGTLLTLESVSALAYGARTTTAGTIALPHRGAPVAYDLQGHAAGVDLRAIPRSLKMPRVPSDFALDYHVTGQASTISGNATFDRSMFTGAVVEAGTTATFNYDGDLLRYSAAGRLGAFDLRRFGRDFEIETLTEPRFSSDINGDFRVSGSGTNLERLRLTADGRARGSTLFGATFPDSPFHVTIADRALDGKAQGAFTGLDPAIVAAGGLPSGRLNGQFDMSVGLQHLGLGVTAADDLSLSGSAALQASVLRDIKISSAHIDGRYANRAADFKRFDVEAPLVRLSATGPLSLNDSQQSALAYHLEAAQLDRLGGLIGQPLGGEAVTDGRVYGNAKQLRIAGTLRASNARVSAASALSLSSNYDVTVPELSVADATGHLKSSATFVEFGGIQINQVTMTTGYAKREVEFDIDARQPRRHLALNGLVVLHPERQEVRFRQLAIESGGATWQIAAGSRPVVDYGNDRLAVSDVRLVNGNQSVEANGTVGRTASDLGLRLSNVQLATVDALMLSEPRLSGVLDAQATLTGPRDHLHGTARFSVARGAFGQFAYQSLGGTMSYAGNRIGVDARLDENARSWIALQGSVPTALFAATPSATADGSPIDLRVSSSALDLAFVQGFTNALRNVTGTLAVEAKVGGTASDPRPEGTVAVTNGAFTVAPTGVRYTNANVQLALHPDGVSVQKLSLADARGKELSVSGNVAVAQRQLGTARLRVKANDFQVVDNDWGRVPLDIDMTVEGDLRRPRLTGTTTVRAGRVDADKLIQLATVSPYSTTPTSVPATASGETEAEERQSGSAPATGAGGWLDASALDIRVRVPGDLVVRGTDIRVGQNPIGFGKVNLTVGGDVQVQKPAQAPVKLAGTVRLINGSYEFQGRTFDIERSSVIRFQGTRRIDPSLDIRATRLITGVETTVRLTGTLLKPQLVLTSDPPLDQADILALIIFGQPVNQLGEGQQASLAQRATGIASGLVASRVAQSIGNALNLDLFEIGAEETAGQVGAMVTLGQQLGQRAYIRLEQGVGMGAASTTQFVLDYQLTRFLRFETTVSQGESQLRNAVRRIDQSGADLIFMFSY